MSRQFARAVVNADGVLLRGGISRPWAVPAHASLGRRTRGPSWAVAMPLDAPIPTSAMKKTVAVAKLWVEADRGALSAWDLVFGFRRVAVGVGLRREPPNHAFQPPVRFAWGWSVVDRDSAAPRPAAERERSAD